MFHFYLKTDLKVLSLIKRKIINMSIVHNNLYYSHNMTGLKNAQLGLHIKTGLAWWMLTAVC